MQFKVPQFLDIEDKIFGPFTFKEFVYLAGGAGLCFMLYKLLGLVFGAIPILLFAGLSLALVFYKPNNKPFLNMIEAGFNYIFQDKLYIWKKHQSKMRIEDYRQNSADKNSQGMVAQNGIKLSGNKLRDLAWSLDVLDLNKHNNTGN